MMQKKLYRAGGALTAAMLLLSQLTAVPALGASLNGKSATAASYSKAFDTTVDRATNLEVELQELGVPATETVTEVLVDVTIDTSSGLPIMPAFGYTAPGCGDYDWYSDGIWMQDPVSQCTISFPVSEEYAMPSSFQLQIWGDEGETIGAYKVTAIGVNTEGGGNIGVMTRKGDLTDDKLINADDVHALDNYLLGGEAPAAPANGDLDRNNRLSAADLTLLKRGLLNGSLGGESTDETAMEFVSHLKMGWNLGNTLDATVNNYYSPTAAETAWGCPMTTKAMIDLVKSSGFNTVRIPVTWGEKCSGDNFTIDDAWMNRVQEVVDYAIDDGMYVILNIHHDNEQRSNNAYFYPDDAHKTNSEKFISSVWTQIATRFEGYDNHLIFETLNEPRLVGTSDEWNGGTSAARAIVNEYNAVALDAIRATGGNNAKRFVMMPGYAASSSANAVNDIVLPDDDHLIVSIHGYAPYNFALNRTGTDQWDEASGSYEIVQIFELAKNKFTSKGIPVIIGEFGAMNKTNESTRAKWVKFYLETADSYGIPCVWWDNNQFFDSRNVEGESFGLINRNTLTVEYPEIMAAMVEATKNRGNS